MTTDERMDRLTTIVESLASSAVHHDNQIEAHTNQIGGLITAATRNTTAIENFSREWQAYINTLPRH